MTKRPAVSELKRGQLGRMCVAALCTLLASCAPALPSAASAAGGWQTDFNLANRQLFDTGEATFFILKPGFQITLASSNARLVITVLDETRVINGITTRVVEEREEKNGELYEVARNFYAMDPKTGDAFYFGEEVDFYAGGKVTGHTGAWLAYDGANRPGMIMPGTPVPGAKYYQEIAPGVAMDRAEVIRLSERYRTPAGEFTGCLVTRESSAIDAAVERKTYAPGIGLIQDQNLKLVSYGYMTK